MHRTLMTLAATASIAAATLAAPTEAQARCRGCWIGAGVAAAAVGGAILANRAYGYGYGYYGDYRYAPDYGSYGYGYAPAYYNYEAPMIDYASPAYYGYGPAYYPNAPRYYGYRPYYAPRRVYAPRYYW